MRSYLLFDYVNTLTRMSELPDGSQNNNRRTFWGLSGANSFDSVVIAVGLARGVCYD